MAPAAFKLSSCLLVSCAILMVSAAPTAKPPTDEKESMKTADSFFYDWGPGYGYGWPDPYFYGPGYYYGGFYGVPYASWYPYYPWYF